MCQSLVEIIVMASEFFNKTCVGPTRTISKKKKINLTHEKNSFLKKYFLFKLKKKIIHRPRILIYE